MRILWIPHTGWHVPQRAHIFCRALSERHEIHVTDWVADFSSPRDYISTRYLRNFSYRRYQDDKITVHGIPRFSPAIFFSSLRRLNENVYSRYLRMIIEKYQIDAVVGTFVVPPPQSPRMIFDLFDDNVGYWKTFGRVAEYAEEIKRNEDAYTIKADAIVVASSVLADRVREIAPDKTIHLIPNGVDLKLFEKVKDRHLYSDLGDNGPLVGVVGNHDKPNEINKIIDVASILSSENVTFLIVGRGAALAEAKKRVQRERMANIRFLGYVPLHEAAGIFSALDVGLCPYEKTPGADASCPMRLLVYAAAGLPTVCTDLEEVRRMNFPNVVLVSHNGRSLAEGIMTALNMERKQPPQIHNYDINLLARKYEEILEGN